MSDSDSSNESPFEGMGCAAMILAIFIGIALVMWAMQGFPGLR